MLQTIFITHNHNLKQNMIMPTKITIFLLMMILFINTGQGSNMALQVLGFQQWEQPSAQQIKAQYKQLTDNYNQNENKDAETVEKYQKVKKAYQELSQQNFMLGEERRQRNNMFNQRQRPRRGRPGYYHQYETFNTDNFHFENSDTIKINWDQIFNDIDFTFMGTEKGKTKISFDFIDFLIKNPLVVLAAFLISLGLLNLCTCCCCCCCRCCRRSEQQTKKEKEENGQPKRKQLINHDRLWLQMMKKNS